MQTRSSATATNVLPQEGSLEARRKNPSPTAATINSIEVVATEAFDVQLNNCFANLF